MTATRQWLPLRAASAVEKGSDFPIVWVCDEEDWNRGGAELPGSAVPWPAESVELMEVTR